MLLCMFIVFELITQAERWAPSTCGQQVLGAASSGARANILCDSTGVWENKDIFKLKISSTGVPFPRRSKKPKEKTPGQVLYC